MSNKFSLLKKDNNKMKITNLIIRIDVDVDKKENYCAAVKN